MKENLQHTDSRQKAKDLFGQIRDDNEEAFRQLFTIYFPRLNDFAKKVTRDDGISQDIVQEVFVRVWEKRTEITDINPEAFLFRLVRNGCIDYIKHLKVINNRMQEVRVESKYEELYRIDFIGNEPYVLIEEEVKNKIDFTIRNLPERCREVFILSRLNGLKNREIAEKLNISIKNVERHLSRAFQSFRENFSDELPVALVVLVIKSLES
jgi:RNA polymerase sigma-70 factor (ECF subfamily)